VLGCSSRAAILSVATAILLVVPAWAADGDGSDEDAGATHAPPAALPDDAEAPSVRPSPQRTPAQLFAAAERAWIAGDAAALAALCDSASVRIAIKPGGSPAAAPTLRGVAFLIRDQLHLVATREFRVSRFETDAKKRTSRASARWNGDWGGEKGVRSLNVVLSAKGFGDGSWLLTEIHAED
jgi:hypothetical protein